MQQHAPKALYEAKVSVSTLLQGNSYLSTKALYKEEGYIGLTTILHSKNCSKPLYQFNTILKMVLDIIKNCGYFHDSFKSICLESILFSAICFIMQFYCARIYVCAAQMKKTEFFGISNGKCLEILPNGLYPHSENEKKSEFLPNGLCPHSENEQIKGTIQREDLVRIFDALDSNKDGSVSGDDILGLLEMLGLRYSCDDDMKIMMGFQEHMNCNDFCKLCLSLWDEAECEESMHEGEMREAFSVFDKDGDGFITPSELQQVLLSLRLREGQELQNCETMIARFDRNCDGRIDFMEFKYMMKVINGYE